MPMVDSLVVLAFGFDLIMFASGLPYMRSKVFFMFLNILDNYNKLFLTLKNI